MIPIEHIQFAAITLTGFLTLMLVFILPLRGSSALPSSICYGSRRCSFKTGW